MAMVLHTGVPGAGKTYLLVKTFVDLFCEYDKETERFQLTEQHKDKILVSNIQGLTIEHLDLETLMNERSEALAKARWFENDKAKDIEQMDDVIDTFYAEIHEEKIRHFFTYNHQEYLSQKHGPLIYLIEESQRYFDSKELGRQKWVRDVLFFFEKHRHLGFSMLMDTQHISKLHKGISVLFESEIQAKPRTLSIAGEFKYNQISDGCKTNQVPIVVKPDQRIFKVYKSMSHNEQIKPKKPFVKLISFIVFCIVASIFGFQYFMGRLVPDEVQASEVSQVSPGPQVASNAVQGKKVFGSSVVVPDSSEWVRLSYVIYRGNQINVVHPITNAIIALRDIDLPVRQVGDTIFCDISKF
jgi:hypothetical protein